MGYPELKSSVYLDLEVVMFCGIKVTYWQHLSCAEDKTKQEKSFLGSVYAM